MVDLMVRIVYGLHAEMKIKERGLDKRIIESAINNPDWVTNGFYGRTIFEKRVDEKHKIKVVCEKEDEVIRVLTSYITKVGR